MRVLKIADRIWKKLTEPINENMGLFLTFFLLSTPAPLYFMFSRKMFGYGMHIAVLEAAMAYIVTLFISLFSRRGLMVRIVKSLLLLLYVLTFIVNTFCIISLDTTFGLPEAAKVIETNFEEGTSFMSMYLTAGNVTVVFVACAFILFVARQIGRRLPVRRPVNNIVGVVIFILGAVFGVIMAGRMDIMTSESLGECVLLKPMMVYSNVDYYPTPSQMHTSTTVLPPMTSSRKKIVVVIGESFVKSHSSLYGYTHDTNPRLRSLAQSGNLYTVDPVVSAETHTIDAFKKMLVVEGRGYGPWYRQDNIIDLLQKGGYRVNWMSNQAHSGLYNNTATCFANLCDTAVYTIPGGNNYDCNLLSVIRGIPQNPGEVDFIHIMGSHEAFYNRYPSEFGRFTPDMYADKPLNQREVLAQYDNSVLYNDSFIAQLASMYDSIPTIMLYFPDHGLDIYETKGDYAGHARRFSARSDSICRQIPFMMIVNNLFKAEYPEMTSRISRLAEKPLIQPFNLDDLPYLIMDIAGIRFADNDDVDYKSPLRR